MRTLSATLLAAQKAVGVLGSLNKPLWKLTLIKSGQATKTYTSRDRLPRLRHVEQDDNYTAEVILSNYDQTLNNLDFEQYWGVLSYGYNTASGDEYSDCAPLKVTGQQFYSSPGNLLCALELEGAPNLMKKDLSRSERVQTADDENTCKDLMNAIADTTIAPTGAAVYPYSAYQAWTIEYDSEDSLIDVFIPADYFNIYINDPRWTKIKELLNYTGCKMRWEDDYKLHILVPVTSGAVYDYEYKLLTSGYQAFFNKSLRNRFISPNYVTVQSMPEQGYFTGYATSATSYALSPQFKTVYARLTSNAQATSIAQAIIEEIELNAESGSGLVPMNCGQEVWDYVNITDSRENDSKAGNIRYIERLCDVNLPCGQGGFDMNIAFGKPTLTGLGLLRDSDIGAGISPELLAMIMDMYNDVENLYVLLYKLVDYIIPGDNIVFNKNKIKEKHVIPHFPAEV